MNDWIYTCTCKKTVDAEGGYILHEEAADCVVQCDSNCGAPAIPVTIDDYMNAYEHWKRHRHLSGCAHGN